MKRCVKESYALFMRGAQGDYRYVMKKYYDACKRGLITDAEAIAKFGEIWWDSRISHDALSRKQG